MLYLHRVPDALFTDPRLAAIYDVVDGDRSDLPHYLRLVEELGARSVLDVGCGTGCLALLLAQRDLEVVGLDPAAASLDVARRKPGADRVRWLLGDVSALPPLQVDAVTMTGNVAQVFLEDLEWRVVLEAAFASLRPGGVLVFETRQPQAQAWRGWTPEATRRRLEVRGDVVETWYELLAEDGPLVTFRGWFRFEQSGETVSSTSTLRFRSLEEVEDSLAANGFTNVAVREAPDRPGLEYVFVARRGEC